MLHRRFVSLLASLLAVLFIAQPALAQGTAEYQRTVNPLSPDAYGVGVKAAGGGLKTGGTSDRELRMLGTAPRSYDKQYLLARDVSDCLVRKIGAQAGAMIDLSAEEAADYRALGEALEQQGDACVRSVPAGIPMALVNAALAEAAVREVAPIATPMTAALRAEAKTFVTGGQARVTFATIGRCLAVEAQEAAFALLGTRPGSKAEATALGALYAKAPQCGIAAPPEGVPDTYQRAMVALGLWGWRAHHAG